MPEPAEPEVGDLPDEAWLLALAALPRMGPRRLLALTALLAPREAWGAACSAKVLEHPPVSAVMGRDPVGVANGWRQAAAVIDVAQRWEAHRGITVAGRSHRAYPPPLLDDIEPPAVVFMRGDPGIVDGPRVAVIGTRRCTRAGFETSEELGRQLALAGVRVVSGLALGIDGAAHRGALDAGPGAAPPIAVVASGVDVVYPKRHRALWHEIVDTGGLLVSEYPLGTKPEAWRFPARNRIIAGLAEAVVVVESPGTGGSMYTVDAAADRDVPVFAVPGSVRSPASAGTNQLIFDGAFMARDASDVLAGLGLEAPLARRGDRRSSPSPEGQRVLTALGWEPATLGALAIRTGIDLGPLAVAIATLEGDGWVARQGLWFERIGAP